MVEPLPLIFHAKQGQAGAGLGWLLGNRFLMLTHTGRKSGLPHHTVIEVVQYEQDTDIYYVVSGWGERSDWYRNIRKSGRVTVQAGRRKFGADAEFIDSSRAVDIIKGYAREHPFAFRELSGLFLGSPATPGADAARQIADKMPMVAFHPA